MKKKKSKCSDDVSLYRFYNMDVGQSGEPFALCIVHRKTQVIPESCILHKIADKAIRKCQAEEP